MNHFAQLRKRQLLQDNLSFWVTNRIPRALLTRLMGRISKWRSRTFARFGIAIWRYFGDLDLREAEKTEFDSIHDCFVRHLKPNARNFGSSPDVMCSPCDAIVGAHGKIEHGCLMQAKGMVYELSDLMQSHVEAQSCEGYSYLTLRLTASMYHHFHSPHDSRVKRLRYIHGDVWNVNPPTLKRIHSLFAKNERAVIEMDLLRTSQKAWLIPVAAVLVASMRFTFSDIHLHLDYQGPTEHKLDTLISKGQEMGWFEHGSTIICLIPPNWSYIGPATGEKIRAGNPLWHKA